MAAGFDTSLEKRTEMRQAIDQIVKLLSRNQREVLLLHAVEGFTSEEIALAIGVSPKTVRTRLFRIRKMLLENSNSLKWMQSLDGVDS